MKGPATNLDDFFRKSAQGVGILNPKIYIADFGDFKQVFLSMKLIQKSNFRVKGIFFQQLYCITPISGNDVHAFHTIWPSYLLAYMQPYPL